MHCVKPLPFEATAPRAATPVVVTARFGCHPLQRPCSTQFYGWRSQSSYPKLPSIFPRNLQRITIPTVSHIPHATKDGDAIADAQLASAAEAFMPDVWPDFSKMKIDPSVRVKFFNRKKGYGMIIDHLKEEPTVSLLLLGPKNSGKSELIKILKEQEGPRMLHIDLGMHDTSSPALMAQQLHKQARKLPNVLDMQCLKVLASQLGPLSNLYEVFYPKSDNTAILDAAPPMEKIANAFMADVLPPYTATNLTAVIDAYNMILHNLPPEQTKPIIVIDEVNALQLWKKGYDANSRDDQVLGDLTSAEAFVYLCGGKVLNRNGVLEDWPGLIAQSKEIKTLALKMTPEDWKKVWSVCGGNIHLLKVCVGYAKQSKSWEKGVAKTLLKPQMDVAEALEFPELIDPPIGSTGPRIWEGKHYKTVLRLIAANPYHAVRRNEVHAALKDVGVAENVTAAQVLLSMVEFNVLSLRPYSEMAEDIPREAFFKEEWGLEEGDNVVTMPSPAHLAAVLLLETKFQKQDAAERIRAQAEEVNKPE
ncbi:hypothetical protein NADE_009283 [Nannochloris sp. 'desiccata']|nr:hypothetical protein NADE_009283 [Chlorella desiccata (nom. nud.)]